MTASYGATFRMGVLLPNYPEKNVVKGDNVPNFSKVKAEQGMVQHMVRSMVSPMPTQGMVQGVVHWTIRRS